MISCNFYLFLHIAENQRPHTAVQQLPFSSAGCSNHLNTRVMPKSVVRIACACSIGLVVSQQNGSCLHFRVYHVFVGDSSPNSSHIPYCMKLNVAHCRVQCRHPAIDEVMYLLSRKIVQAILLEY